MKKGILLSMFLMNNVFNICAENTNKAQEHRSYSRAEMAGFMEALSSRSEEARSWIQGFALAGLVIGLCRRSERQRPVTHKIRRSISAHEVTQIVNSLPSVVFVNDIMKDTEKQTSSSMLGTLMRLTLFSVAGALIGFAINQGVEFLGDYLDDERAKDPQVKSDDQFVDLNAQRGWEMARALSVKERLMMPFQREQDHRKLFFKIKKEWPRHA